MKLDKIAKICFNVLTTLFFVLNIYFTIRKGITALSVMACAIFIVLFFVALWFNSFNKIFSIIKWVILGVALIAYVIHSQSVILPDWLSVVLSYFLIIPFFGTMALAGLFIGLIGETYAFHICIGGFLIICVIISIVQEILKYKRKDDENEKVEDS